MVLQWISFCSQTGRLLQHEYAASLPFVSVRRLDSGLNTGKSTANIAWTQPRHMPWQLLSLVTQEKFCFLKYFRSDRRTTGAMRPCRHHDVEMPYLGIQQGGAMTCILTMGGTLSLAYIRIFHVSGTRPMRRIGGCRCAC